MKISKLSANVQIVHISGFVGHLAVIATIQLCHCSPKAAADNTPTKGCGYVPIKLRTEIRCWPDLACRLYLLPPPPRFSGGTLTPNHRAAEGAGRGYLSLSSSSTHAQQPNSLLSVLSLLFHSPSFLCCLILSITHEGCSSHSAHFQNGKSLPASSLPESLMSNILRKEPSWSTSPWVQAWIMGHCRA